MDAVILDVGGVLLVPHADAVNPALAPFGIHLTSEQAERAHYAGARSLDAADPSEDLDGAAYLISYAAGVGVAAPDREEALVRLRAAFSNPSSDVWRQQVMRSVDGLRSLAAA